MRTCPHELSDIVSCIGRVPHHDLKKYFDEANVGVSFVPLLAHYQYQPPTKTFEYLMSGLYCIATSTIANKEIISDQIHTTFAGYSEGARPIVYCMINKVD